MKVGLLWYDDDPGRDLGEKIGRAARRYRQKFDTPASVCYVHPSTLSNNGRMRKVGECAWHRCRRCCGTTSGWDGRRGGEDRGR